MAKLVGKLPQSMDPEQLRRAGQQAALAVQSAIPARTGFVQKGGLCESCGEKKASAEFRKYKAENGEGKSSPVCFACEAEIMQAYHEDQAYQEYLTRSPLSHDQQVTYLTNLYTQLLHGIPRQDIRAMKIRDRVEAAGKIFDKVQLLQDKPTQIHGIQDKRRGTVLLEALYAEIQRKKRTIDVTPHEASTPLP